MTECPICGSQPASITGWKEIDCPRCGRVAHTEHPSDISRGMANLLGDWNDDRSVRRRSLLSHLLRHVSTLLLNISPHDLDRRLNEPLPSPIEQLDYLISWLGDHQRGTEPIRVQVPEIEAWIGARINRQSPGSGLAWLLKQPETERLVEWSDTTSAAMLRMLGWERYHALKQGSVESRKAFMAMKFGEEDVEHAYNNCFKPAVALTGFKLFDIREQQRAGMIDDHIRVAIRNSRFVLADLSHECRGSYWEGGFAEGLGRPVIYTCNAEKWGQEKPHFDTNHLATIIWNANNLEQAAQELKAIIRNTLPSEAQMDDQEGGA